MPEYPKVKRAHIVPKSWLRNFADEDRMIGMRLVNDPGTEHVIPIKKAATRKEFYRRTRPDGTPIDDVEWSLSVLEARAAPILRTVEARWPLDSESKRVLAELFAAQLLRGVRWLRGYEKRTDRLVEEYLSRGDFDEGTGDDLTAEEVAEHHRELFLSDTHRLRRMLFLTPKGSAALGSMIWSLVQFSRPMLVTADHPVTGWSLWEASSRPKPTPDGLGLINLLEIRVPVSPTAAILMAWLDRPDDVAEPFDGTRRHARNLNAFTIAQAETQWFHYPGANPSYGKRRSYPALGIELVPGYGPEAAEASALRRVVHERVNARLGEDTNEYEIIKLGESTDAAWRI